MIVAREQVQQNYGLPREKKYRRPSPGRERRLSPRHRAVYTGLVVLGFVAGVLISFYYAQVFMTNYRIQSLQGRLATLQKETDDLYSELTELKSLDRIESIAVKELGMIAPDKAREVRIAVEGSGHVTSGGQDNLSGRQAVREKESGEGGTGRRNWVIAAFSDLVSQVNKGVPSR